MTDAPLPDYPAALLGFWVAEDASKSLRVAREGEGELRVSVWRGLGPEAHIEARPTRWHPPSLAHAESANARRRLGYLQVELGAPGLGTTYDLLVGWPSPAETGYQWIAAPPDAERADLRLFPEGGASFHEAVLGVWDDFVEDEREREQGWLEPLSTYRPATPAEAAQLARLGRPRA